MRKLLQKIYHEESFYAALTAVLLFVLTPMFMSGAAMDSGLMPRRLYLMFAFALAAFLFRRFIPQVLSIIGGIPHFRLLLLLSITILLTAIAGFEKVSAPSEFYNEIIWMLCNWIIIFVLLLWGSAVNNRLLLLARASTISALLLTGIAALQYFNLAFNSLPGNYVVYATMTNKNLLSNVLVLHLPFMIYLAIKGHRFERLIANFVLLLTMFVGVIAATRSAWLGCILAFLATVAAVALSKHQTRGSKKRRLAYSKFSEKPIRTVILAAIAGIILGAFCYHTYTRQDLARDKALTGASIKLSSAGERITLWKKSLQMIGENPWLGVGAGQWKFQLPRFGSAGMRSAGGELNFVRPHNDLIWIAAERGIPAFIAYLWLFAILLALLFRLLKSTKTIDREIAYVTLFGLVAYLVSAFFSFPRERVVPSLYLLTNISLLFLTVSTWQKPAAAASRRKLSGTLITAALLILSMTTGAFFGWRWYCERQTRELLLEINKQDWKKAALLATEVQNPFYEVDPTAIPLATYAGQAYVQLGDYQRADSAFVLSHRLHPYHLLTLGNLAAVCHRAGDVDKAIFYCQEALKISPHFDKIIINLAILYIQKAAYSKAWDIMEQCDPYSIDPRVGPLKNRIRGLMKEATENP